MARAGVFRLVFSSSAMVCGELECMPIAEGFPTGTPTSHYGRSKLMVDEALRDLAAPDLLGDCAVALFQPGGGAQKRADQQRPNGISNNLLPYISQVAIGKLPELAVFGDDYPTRDGIGIRDYSHVADLVAEHLKALNCKCWFITGIGTAISSCCRSGLMASRLCEGGKQTAVFHPDSRFAQALAHF